MAGMEWRRMGGMGAGMGGMGRGMGGMGGMGGRSDAARWPWFKARASRAGWG